MSRCGCNEACSCVLTEGPGIDITGTGNPNSPYNVTFDGSEVLGNGLAWQASGVGGTLSTKLAPGGGLEFDVTGAMRTSGGGGGGSAGATVTALEALTTDVIGSAMGGGFLHKPVDLISSFKYAQTIGVDFIQVPVRFLADGTPVVSFSETMPYVDSLADFAVDTTAQQVQAQSPSRWRVGNLKPGAFYVPQRPATGSTDVKTGWFGWLEPGQYGLTFLVDVLREIDGKVVLLLNLMFPATDVNGNFINATPAWRTEIFLLRLVSLITSMGLTANVIVTTNMPFIPQNTGPTPTDVLKRFSDIGVKVGPTLDTQALVNAYPANDPTKFQATWTWVFLPWSLPRASLTPYIKPGLNTILFYVSRQYLRSAVVHSSAQGIPGAAGIGAKGVISADPEYYAGVAARGQLIGQKYREVKGPWQWGTVHHGLIPQGAETVSTAHPNARGWSLGNSDTFQFPTDLPVETGSNSAYEVLGEYCPVNNPDQYTVDWSSGFSYSPTAAQYGWNAIAFSVLADHGFKDKAATVVGDPAYQNDGGYFMLMDSNAFAALYLQDKGTLTQIGANYKWPVAGDLNAGQPKLGTFYRFRIGVSANGIKVIALDAAGNSLGVVWNLGTAASKLYRGAYIYLGYYKPAIASPWAALFQPPWVQGGNVIP